MNRCPECGNAFDPNDPDTFEIEGQAGPWSWRKWCLAVLCSYVVALPIGFLLMSALATTGGLPTVKSKIVGAAFVAFFSGPVPFIIIGWLAADLRSRPFTSVFDDDDAI